MAKRPIVRLSDLPPEQRDAIRAAKRRAKRAAERKLRDYFEGAVGVRPQTEYQFAADAGRKWAFDVAFVEQRVALEVEGGVWSEGRHTRGSGFLADMEKYNAAAVRGWRLLRCVPDDLYGAQVVQLVRDALKLNPGG